MADKLNSSGEVAKNGVYTDPPVDQSRVTKKVSKTEAESNEDVNLNKLTKDELLAQASAKGVTVPDGATKADIIALLEA